MAFVTNKRWEQSRGGTQTIDRIDSAPTAILDAWGIPITKRWIDGDRDDVTTIDNGKRFRIGANTLLRWEHKASMADLKGFPDEGGGFKETIQLDAAPAVARWRSRIDCPQRLTFNYQPALTAEEVAEGAVRPDWCVGSYAVFDTTGAKIGHMPRPYAITALGEKRWFDLAVNDNPPSFALLTITGDLAWLKSLPPSAFPVMIDPTFGYTTAGASTNAPANAVAGVGTDLTYAATAGDTITMFHVHALTTGSGQAMAAYTITGTTPAARLAAAAGLPAMTATRQWWTVAVSQVMTAATYCVAMGDWSGSANLSYDSRAGTNRRYNNNTTLPATWTNSTSSGATYSLYATYTAAAAAFFPWHVRSQQSSLIGR